MVECESDVKREQPAAHVRNIAETPERTKMAFNCSPTAADGVGITPPATIVTTE